MNDNNASYANKWRYNGAGERYDTVIYGDSSWDSLLSLIEEGLFRELLGEHCPAHSEASSLDFACGTGRILLFLRPLVRSVLGVDISSEMLHEARKKVHSVQLLCTDIVTSPESVPGSQDVITCFRFLLNAEPELRLNCVRELSKKLRSENSIIVFGIHGNPWNYRSPFVSLCTRVRKGRPSSRGFSLRDMRELASACGLEIVDATGFGFIPRHVGKYVPRRVSILVERALAGRLFFWRFGSNLIVICRRKMSL